MVHLEGGSMQWVLHSTNLKVPNQRFSTMASETGREFSEEIFKKSKNPSSSPTDTCVYFRDKLIPQLVKIQSLYAQMSFISPGRF